jgi:hypothetical protein
MTAVRYCTPEWLEKSFASYQATSKFKEAFKKLTMSVFFLVEAEPDWGIDEAIIFGCAVEKGELLYLDFFSESDAKEKAEFILGATPQEWKQILRKEKKFVTDFMLGKITLEQGSKVGVLSIAPYADTFVDALTQHDLQFPDEMSAEELEAYRAHFSEFRAQLGV